MMTTTLVTDRYRDRLHGVLNCYDRVVITETIPGACFARGMTSVLSPGFDLAPLQTPVLLQRPFLAGTTTDRSWNRVCHGRQRFCSHRRLCACAAIGRRLQARRPPSRPRSPRQPVLPGPRRVRARLPLEPDASRVFHRSGVPVADHVGPFTSNSPNQAVLAVKAEQVSTFLDKKLTPQVAQEIGSRLSTRIEGTCIKHRMGSVSIKLYDRAVSCGWKPPPTTSPSSITTALSTTGRPGQIRRISTIASRKTTTRRALSNLSLQRL